MRAPFQVLVIPFKRTGDGVRFGVFHRADADVWQWIAGGGENDETPVQAARREALEEAGIDREARLIALESVASIPVHFFSEHVHWDANLLVIPEHSFGIEVTSREIRLCAEHRAVHWLTYDEASARVTFDSNRTALWELVRRLERGE
jgi:dATP pyrophosphohydrolase